MHNVTGRWQVECAGVALIALIAATFIWPGGD
jgi:hypothetical protein